MYISDNKVIHMNKNINLNHGELTPSYLSRMMDVINKGVNEHPRTFAIRIDLRLPGLGCHAPLMEHDMPTSFAKTDSSVISRFFSSLEAKIISDINARKRTGTRVHSCTLRYAWVKEQNNEHKDHYHTFILLNKDTYAFLGQYTGINNLAYIIMSAWSSALGLHIDLARELVHLPENPCYYLDVNKPDFNLNLDRFIYRISYMAKAKSKNINPQYRSFGCSNR
ncbi:conserved hypothetical protein [Tolumonas auensis DSM 9187]|uniref:YagK/YfjJ C-terminal domain-containing protein n=2 Tax=Tolumonas TaxID=43947 RepID=C4LDJ4_TOLAT|nr:conserved hypothetical protein [Tolumonas auensis DSM 9187]